MTLQAIYSPCPVEYTLAYKRQKEFHARRVAGDIGDTLWLLEHLPVLTTGIRKNQQSNILLDTGSTKIPIIQTDRGGQVTYHGPGQLVGYLFISMENHGFKVKQFVSRLENGIIDYLQEEHKIQANHDDTHTGVWVGNDKIAAIGLSFHQKVSMHGFALNINTNLEHFDWIIPCGITESQRGVTSVEKIYGHPEKLKNIAPKLAGYISKSLGYANLGYQMMS